LPGNSYKHLDDARVGKGHATIEAFSHMSDQGFIGETEASSGGVISQFSGADSRGRFRVGEELIV
jgi:hypothetical protein